MLLDFLAWMGGPPVPRRPGAVAMAKAALVHPLLIAAFVVVSAFVAAGFAVVAGASVGVVVAVLHLSGLVAGFVVIPIAGVVFDRRDEARAAASRSVASLRRRVGGGVLAEGLIAGCRVSRRFPDPRSLP